MKLAALYRTDGTVEPITPANGNTFTLEELYELIETDVVEVVYLRDGSLLIVDEEGLLKKHIELNIPASSIAGQRLVGQVVHCARSMVE